MANVAGHGNRVNNEKVFYAKTTEAMTIPDASAALGVVLEGSDVGLIRLPTSDGELPAGFIHSQKDIASGDEIEAAYGEFAWMPVAEAVTIGAEVMLGADVGKEGWIKLLAGTDVYKFGVAWSEQSTVGGYALIKVEIGSKKEV